MVFNSCFDIIGPVMVGPSSSHTAGVVAIGKFGHDLLGEIPKSVNITFYDSFSETYQGHGTDKAVIGGLLGLGTDNPEIKHAFELAEKERMNISFEFEERCPYYDHPNTLLISMKSRENSVEIGGVSLGGGVSKIFLINGQPANILLNSKLDMESMRERYLHDRR
ncbi:serine dehydratase beta chain [Siminovitchia sediminis]|uniref:L-serine ammonia-lyase n=1 Tax=Siminovitchia sediminis TaxID=1274353 RepID=A0ABW4KKR1_9BACI